MDGGTNLYAVKTKNSNVFQVTRLGIGSGFNTKHVDCILWKYPNVEEVYLTSQHASWADMKYLMREWKVRIVGLHPFDIKYFCTELPRQRGV